MGHAWQGAHAWQRQCASQGTCMVGGMHGRGHVLQGAYMVWGPAW